MVDAGEITTVFRNIAPSHPNTIAETTLIEHLLLTERDTHHLDFSALTQVTTIRVFERTDGVNYRQLSQRVFPTDYEPGSQLVIIVLDGAAQDMKITLESSVMEGSPTIIPGTVRDELRQ